MHDAARLKGVRLNEDALQIQADAIIGIAPTPTPQGIWDTRALCSVRRINSQPWEQIINEGQLPSDTVVAIILHIVAKP